MDKNFVDIADRLIKEAKEQADLYIKEFIDPIAKIPTPDKIIGHPYPFNKMELEALQKVYVYSPQDLEDYIAKSEIAELIKLQEEVKILEA